MDKTINTEMLTKYRNANRRLVLLDYDGTLVNYTSIPDTTRVSNQLYEILTNLAGTLRTETFIITGRRHDEIDKILILIPINIIAEHGAMIKKNGKWENQINKNDIWKRTVVPILTRFTSECPGSFIEKKNFTLAWHYRNAKPQLGFSHSKELISILEKFVISHDLKILHGNKVVEIMPRGVGKGYAAKKLFEQNKYDFILSIGDDTTDEEIFEYFLNKTNAFTIKVGNGKTFAKYKLPSVDNVVSLLKNLLQ